MSLFTEYEFSKCVKRYKGDRHAIKFNCRDQFLVMSFHRSLIAVAWGILRLLLIFVRRTCIGLDLRLCLNLHLQKRTKKGLAYLSRLRLCPDTDSQAFVRRRKYDGNRYVKHFTCWNQLLAMMFGQLSNRESLRDLIVALDTHQGKRIIWDWVVNPSPKQHLHQPIKIGIIGSSKTSLSIWWKKLVKNGRLIF